ncbi:Lipoprotein YhcN precursor [compost metagenome]
MLRAKIGMTVSAALLVSMIGLTGCGTTNNQGAVGTNTVKTQSVRDGRLGIRSVRGEDMSSLSMNDALSHRIAAMKGVKNANVFVVGRSAYVAVSLDNQAPAAVKGTTTKGVTPKTVAPRAVTPKVVAPKAVAPGHITPKAATPGHITPKAVAPGHITPRAATPGHITPKAVAPDGFTSKGMNMAPGSTGYGTGNGTGYGTGGGTLYHNRVTGITGTNRIGTLTEDGRTMTGTLTHPAARGGHTYGMYSTSPSTATDGVTPAMKDKISVEVKRSAPHIDNVYVSANPDFVDRIGGFADQVRAGHPIAGFANEFSTLVERIFPTRSGTTTTR